MIESGSRRTERWREAGVGGTRQRGSSGDSDARGCCHGRKHRRKAAKAAAENMVRGSLQSAAEAEAAATETMARVQTLCGLRRTAEVVVEDIEESAGEEIARSFQRTAEEHYNSTQVKTG